MPRPYKGPLPAYNNIYYSHLVNKLHRWHHIEAFISFIPLHLPLQKMSRMSLLRWTRQSCIGASSVRVLGNGSGGARRCFHTPSSVDDFRTSIESNLKTALDRTKGTIFGLMANNMSESDVEKFVRHWGKRIDLHQEVDAKLSSQNKAVLPEKLPAKDDKRTASAPVIDKAMEKIAYATKKDLVLYHPLLGELVADLGYKRVYLTSVNALARTPVWERQRILRPERASLIADDKIRKGMNNALPGVITLYQLDSDDSIGIIDGQHRAGALMILAQRGKYEQYPIDFSFLFYCIYSIDVFIGHWEEHAKNVAVEVFSVGSEAQISTLFREINAAEPVRLIDLPEDTTTVSQFELI